jgi:hypothetical protein
MYIEVDRQNSPARTLQFPNPTFLVANTAPGAKDNLYLAHSAVGLPRESIYLFNGLEGFHWPTTMSGIAPGGAYMVPTNTPGTYDLKWIVDPAAAASMQGISVTLSTRF